MEHKYISENGSLIELSPEESALFNQLILLMKDTEYSLDEIEKMIKEHPILVKAVHGKHGYTALALAMNIFSYKGINSFKLLLENGADLYFTYQGSTLMNKVQNGNNIIFANNFRNIAYDYAKEDSEKISLNILRYLYEIEESLKQLTSEQQTASNTEEVDEKLVVVKEGGEGCCVISILNKVRYDNGVYNHPKFDVMLKIAKDLGVLSDFLSALDNKFIAEQLPKAIEEKKQELIAEQLSIEGKKEILAEIDSVLEDISIDLILTELFSVNSQSQDKLSSFNEILSDFFNSLMSTLRLVALNSFTTTKSGFSFYHGFPSDNPDDFQSSGEASIQFEKSSDNVTNVQMITLFNHTNIDAV